MSAPTATSTSERARAALSAPLGLQTATVAVLMGGRSSERDVSLTSGRTVLEALLQQGDGRGPARALELEVGADGRWRVGGRWMTPGVALDALEGVDVFFSTLHGGEGENGALQGFLTCSDRCFTGSGVVSSAVSMDKVFAREVVAACGLRVAPGLTLTRASWQRARADARGDSEFLQTLAALAEEGCVVKPRRGGSSVGCSIVRGPAELERALELALLEGPEVLVEALVRGVETTAGVVDAPDGEPIALEAVEIAPRGEFFDYHEKYAADGALELCPPRNLDSATCERVRASGLAAHHALGCEGYSRSDFIVPADGGEPVYLETNTSPGLTPRSLLPRAAAVAGIDYRSLCLWIAANGLARGSERRNG